MGGIKNIKGYFEPLSERELYLQELKAKAEKTKAEHKNGLNSYEGNNSLWAHNCNNCYHRFICNQKHNGYICKLYFSSEEHDKLLKASLRLNEARADALNELLARLEKIDPCEFAMFSLGLIREEVEAMTGGQ